MAQLDFKQIGLWVFIWLIGYGLGLFEAWARQKTRKEDQPKVIQAPPQLIEENYALAIFEEGNVITLKMDGAKFQNSAQISEGQRKRLINLVVGLRPWLDGSQVQAKPAPAPIATEPIVPAPVMPISAASKIQSQPLVVERSAEDVEYASLSMVQQIDWILQKKLEGHPLRAKRIRLKGALTGGVEFHVGEQRYEYVGEIEDLEVRALIQQAIADWENKSTPGS